MSSNRFLNIAIGKLVKLWKIGFDEARKPTDIEIKNVLSLIDLENIILNEDECSIYLSKKNMEIDLGALAKGYFADKIKDYLLAKGVKSGIIDLGGNVLTLGTSYKNNHGFCLVGIQNSKENRGNLLGVIPIKDKSVVTSGIYERVLNFNGEKYHYIFDSLTGYPIKNEIASVSVIANKSLDCEIWTTILFSYSIEKALHIINSMKDFECLIIDKNNKIYLSDGIKDIFIKL
ncbi:FAD:protein FMN transferase [Gemella sp. zg-570]|uniref:FAD:protein FMN transferase n=1 Tax=Gemella sp. zg-1178 TaxID=2840372 RepID=UPI00211377D8|nr:FAD:protein FMN transferase [Gemella sp. zg-570]